MRCRATIKHLKKSNGAKIASGDEAERTMGKHLVEAKLPQGTRLLRGELYPVKVEHVNRGQPSWKTRATSSRRLLRPLERR